MRVKITWGSVVLLFFLLLTDRGHLALALLLAVLFHECGHLAAARLLHIPLRELRFDPMGAQIEPAGSVFSYSSEFLLALSGPLFSLLLPLSVFLFEGFCTSFGALISGVSLLLGAINLLPIPGFDGGRMLSSVLASRLPFSLAQTLSKAIGLSALLMLWMGAAYLLLRAGKGFSLFCFSAGLFLRLFGTRDRL